MAKSIKFSGPEKNVAIPFSSQIHKKDKKIIGVLKRFDDPDYASLQIPDPESYAVTWATQNSAQDTLVALDDFIETYEFSEANIFLKHSFKRRGTVMGGSNCLSGELEDVVNEVHDNPERTSSFQLIAGGIKLWWGSAWPMTYHDIPTNEVRLDIDRTMPLSRIAVEQCMGLTAYPDLASKIEVTLDEFAVYEPRLAQI
jgi:hypothetical protein